MLYSKVMKQLQTYRLTTVFIVSLKFLEYGYYEFGGIRTPCVNINNINYLTIFQFYTLYKIYEI